MEKLTQNEKKKMKMIFISLINFNGIKLKI